ncbi:MAG: hypothetical protein Ct9H300mP31_11060 [Acidimicrobiaceae bacterium]|nr:MAG: hypothetical protein Ct9H300mP31_11060 [Acidimicrobiaceae bacterium]
MGTAAALGLCQNVGHLEHAGRRQDQPFGQPSAKGAPTRRPKIAESTSSPTAETRPAVSLPGVKGNGGFTWYSPRHCRTSGKGPTYRLHVHDHPAGTKVGVVDFVEDHRAIGSPSSWTCHARMVTTVPVGLEAPRSGSSQIRGSVNCSELGLVSPAGWRAALLHGVDATLPHLGDLTVGEGSVVGLETQREGQAAPSVGHRRPPENVEQGEVGQ